MKITTTNDLYQNNIDEIMEKVQQDYSQDIIDSGLSFSDWAWKNKKILGEYFFNSVSDYCGWDEIDEKISGI